ncbi:MAG: chromosome segregation protein SMC [Candidatus Aenigmarchaeota archaeon]|nr:chromosome segregation protein SMC [Candidatus Aenigmarchaeota archaeon]
MVRIEKLVMQGFKSFANKTVLPFPSGFNVIGGANGSGKSNIVDAICFVLGIRSTKTIRANKLEQLIFKGGKKRGPAEYAQVTLYLDNEDGEIPGEDKKIKITRKINKNGASIYKLNGRTVNRRKIIDLLSNARIHADGHNIIMQGDVTNLIKMNPIERREIIDEISGIADFEDKKEKAEKELEKVENKLKEARLILNEKKKMLEKLEKEQKLARESKTLEEELKTISGSIIKIRMDAAKESLDKINKELEELESKFKDIDEKFRKFDEELDNKQREIGLITSKVLKRDKNLMEKTKLSREIDKRNAQIDGYIREMQNIENMIRHLSEDSAVIKRLKEMRGVHGTVGELFSTDAKYQNAMEVALGGHINDLIVDSDEVAAECINLLKREKLGRATFLPLNKIRYKESHVGNESGIIGLAINLISYSPTYEPAMRYAFGDTVVVKDLNTARRLIGKYKMVTLDGELVQKSGAMTGGFRKKSRMQEIAEYRRKKEEIEDRIEEVKKEIEELDVKLSNIENKEEEASEEGRVKELTDSISDLRTKRQDLYEKRMTLQSKISNLRIRKTRVETELEGFEMEFEEYKDVKNFVEGTIEALQSQKKKVIEKLRGIGPVNQRAIEDYESMKIFYDDLSKKVERIEKERDAILKMAEQVERRRKEAFMTAFKKVDENFRKIFNELTGGEGRLELENPDDIRTGLIIKARPKGKKALNLDAMSGGEQTMTALSFLFAVQRYKPAPFYILDEIDAALDKINTKKISELIEKQSNSAQFIVITHNDVTMKMADNVYGVTMEDGVSKVIAIKMPEK